MSDNAYDPNRKYDNDKTYNIKGSVVNSISDEILELQRQIRDFADAEVKKELEDLRIRDKNPAVKDAWDKYQTVLGLAVKR